MKIVEILNYPIGNNFGQDYLLVFGLFLVLILLFKIFQLIILIWLKNQSRKTISRSDDLAISIIEKIHSPIYFAVALYLSLRLLNFGAKIDNFIYEIFILIITFEVIVILRKVIDFVIDNKIKMNKRIEGKANKERSSMLKLVGQIAKVFLWITGIIFILSNFGINVRSLVAGLGVGGLIVALAVKDILGDLFVSFSILIDKPFKVGDYIAVSKKESGTVERINLRNTYLRNIQGQLLIVPNKKLASATIENFRTIKRRQTTININFPYKTAFAKISEFPLWIKEIFKNEEDVELVRITFYEYRETSMNFKITFKVYSSEYDVFMKAKNKINYAILKKLKEENIKLDYFPGRFIINQYEDNSF